MAIARGSPQVLRGVSERAPRRRRGTAPGDNVTFGFELRPVLLDFDEASADVLFGSVAEARSWAQSLRNTPAAQASGIDRVEIIATPTRALILGGLRGDMARLRAPHLLRVQNGRETELMLAGGILASLPSE